MEFSPPFKSLSSHPMLIFTFISREATTRKELLEAIPSDGLREHCFFKPILACKMDIALREPD
jgi:hypothetical protein